MVIIHILQHSCEFTSCISVIFTSFNRNKSKSLGLDRLVKDYFLRYWMFLSNGVQMKRLL